MFWRLEGRTPVPQPDVIEYAQWMERADRDGSRVVGRTELPGGVEISTVFLGLNHQHGDGPPVLFETAVFGPDETDIVRRYHSWEEAERGHADVVRARGGG